MKFVVATIMLALAGTAPAADGAQKSPLYWTYQYVIATSDEELSVAQLVFDLPEMHPEMCDREMLDLLAEFLANANVNDPGYRAGLKEVFSILEMRDAARYRTVAEQVAKKAQDSSIRSLAGSYARSHKENVPQYLPGTIDRAALRKQYALDALAAHHPADLALSLTTLPLNGGVDRQFVVAGKPDASLVWQRAGVKKDMPPGSNAKPTAAELDILKKWIEAGAPFPAAERRKFVNGLDCCACGKDAPSHAHHPILLGRGKGQKAPEDMLIPLCESSTGRLGCHDALHLRQGRFAGMTKEQLRAWQNENELHGFL